MTVLNTPQADWSPSDPACATQRSPGAAFEMGKRLIDLAGVAVALVVLGPLLLGCCLWIKCTDGGPVFYRQTRVGRHGKHFMIWKLRTMRPNAELNGPQLATHDDPRIVKGCKWIRRSHIDELPQLLNILRGEMSLVGPRPERPELIEQMRESLPDFDKRLAATPGLTGLAQVRNGYSNDLDGMRRKLDFDLDYLRSRSIRLDLRLIVMTLPLFWDRTAC
ncbi:MAG: sugar transferase [Phycisphaerales bacterium JB063]